jgi:hypothetical protein
MSFYRPDGAYSPVERAVLDGLGLTHLDFAPTAPRRRIEGGAERVGKAAELERLATDRADPKTKPRPTMMPDRIDTAAIAESCNADGYVVVPALFSRDELQNLEAELESYIRNVVPGLSAGSVYYEDEPSDAIKSLFKMKDHSEIFAALARDPRLMAIVGAIRDRYSIGSPFTRARSEATLPISDDTRGSCASLAHLALFALSIATAPNLEHEED